MQVEAACANDMAFAFEAKYKCNNYAKKCSRGGLAGILSSMVNVQMARRDFYENPKLTVFFHKTE